MAKKGKKILIVDDETDITSSVKVLLEHSGYQVTAVNSGKEALQALEKNKFEVIILDILMPKLSGYKVAQKIRQNPKTKNQKIVFLTIVPLDILNKNLIKKLNPADYILKYTMTNIDLRKRIKKIVG